MVEAVPPTLSQLADSNVDEAEAKKFCFAVHVFALPRLRPIVLAVPPLYAPENVSVPFVAVRSARLDPSEILEIVEFCRDAFGTLDTVSIPAEFVSPLPSSDVNVEPPSMKFVDDAVVNDPYVGLS